MKSKLKTWASDFFNWYLLVITILVILPILAPIFLWLGWNGPANAIYLIYSFFCHQFASRSLHLFDYQYAWCARDTGIWLGIAVVAWLMKFGKLRSIKWYWTLPFIIPIALDGGLQTIFTILNIQPVGIVTGSPLYISNNFTRFLTGSFFGIGISLWLSGTLLMQTVGEKDLSMEGKKSIENLKLKIKNLVKKNSVKVLSVFFVLMFVYFGLVQLWNVTSVRNKPSDFADSAVKTPLQDFFERRGDAVCATKGVTDLFNFDCFFNGAKK